MSQEPNCWGAPYQSNGNHKNALAIGLAEEPGLVPSQGYFLPCSTEAENQGLSAGTIRAPHGDEPCQQTPELTETPKLADSASFLAKATRDRYSHLNIETTEVGLLMVTNSA